jgi:RimJ/RimL family protein N-acetyltransferase
MVERIESERLLIRCWRSEDAPLLKDAIDSSLGDLQSWVPWALHEPSPVRAIAERLQSMREQFMENEDWAFGLFERDETRVVGGAGLHARGSTDHLEIGYWLRTGVSGRGLATEAAAALCRTAFAYTRVERLEIHCDADNVRSAAVARRLGFVRDREFRQEAPTARGSHRRTLVWTLQRSAGACPTRADHRQSL